MVVVPLDQYIFALGTLFVSVLVVRCFSVLRHGNVPTRPNLVMECRHTHSVTTFKKDTGIDVVIVGAGVAGSALAHTLGKDGRRVHVIERDLTEPNRTVGEVLMPGGYLKLIELGLEDCLEEIDAQRMFGIVFFKDGKQIRCSYPTMNFHSDVVGRTFHNGRFIQKMREKVATLPNVRMEQGIVTSLIEEDGIVKGVHYKTKSGQELEVFAPLTIVCDGCFSNLRRSLSKSKVDVPSHFVGLVLKNCDLPFGNYGHMILADPSLILFYQISSSEVRCFIDVAEHKLPSTANGEMAKYLRNSVGPHVPKEIRDAFITAVDKGNLRTMPNRTMPANPNPTPGVLLLGDAFNMRHPMTGGGMTVALSDIMVLRNLLRPLSDLRDSKSVCRHLESFYTLRKPASSTINTMAGTLYKVFSPSPDEARKELSQACFEYLRLGTAYSNVFMALLSGLNPNPVTLVLYFLAVVMYGVGRLLLPFPSPKRIWLGARLIAITLRMIFPIMKAEGVPIFPIMKAKGVRQMFLPPRLFRRVASSMI